MKHSGFNRENGLISGREESAVFNTEIRNKIVQTAVNIRRLESNLAKETNC